MTPQQDKNWHAALQRIEKVKQSGDDVLDLAGLGLTDLPEPLFHLANLQVLYLNGNQLTSLSDSIAHLSNLRFLNLDGNQLTTLPESAAQLTNLIELFLSGNQLITLPASITQLTNLIDLRLAHNRLTTLSDSIAQLIKLEELFLGGNQFTTLPNSIAHLTSLQLLDLDGNQLTALPDSVTQLANLDRLFLNNNQLTTLPDSFAQLANLQYLFLDGNRLTLLPDSIAQLTDLESLSLGGNRLTMLPDSITQLTDLKFLSLDVNQLTSLPGSIIKLHKLGIINLSDNQFTTVPEFLADLAKLTALFLHGNAGLGVPDEVFGPTYEDVVLRGKEPRPPREILSYLRKIGDARPLNEAKLIMVGQGSVGKSSLVEKLTTGKFRPGKKATEGIKISDWTCQFGRKDKVTVHIWDFGGQEMMHATHQFFLTPRSLYLLVLNRRQGGADREADYWFRLIRAFGGKDAPVIVVLNKQKAEPFDVNRGNWLEKYAGNIKGFVETDCTDGKSIALLKKKIQEELKSLKSIQTSFPRRWFAIKNELSQMGTQYVTFDQYRSICKKHGESDQENQNSLAGFLHDLGIALNYKDDPRLRFAYVLKPEWVTEGIYALLHAFVAAKGLFTLVDAQRVLALKHYSPEATEFILGLMDQFELSFPLEGRQKQVLIPQLLDDQQPREALSFKTVECLNFGYQYTVIPEGLLPRFIVRTHHLSEPAMRWKSGVILQDEASGCRVLVRSDSTEAQVRIHIDGPEPNRRELLGIVRHNFNVIHRDYEFKPFALVYPPGVPDAPQKLEDLAAMFRSGKATTVPVVLADKTVITPNIAELMAPVKAVPPSLKVFLSYSHQDAAHLKELLKDLKLMERNGLISTWHDRALTAGEKWEPRILQELNGADVIICQLSRDFLASDFCVLTELDTAIQRQEAKTAALIAYVLTDCGWKEVPKLSQFQILPEDAKPLSDWKDKNKYWRAVAEGIQAAIRRLQKEPLNRPSARLLRGATGADG